MGYVKLPWTSTVQVPFGIAIAAGIRVGNMLGAGEPAKAKKASIIAAIFGSE